jgi:ubiquinone/menaquinone biosynthesis C-methylase UbiE
MKEKEEQKHWDRVYRKGPLEELPWEQGAPAKELVKLIESGVVDKGPVLDICCGTANHAIYLATQGFSSYGIDISAKAIEYGKEKALKAGVNSALASGNALRLPYPDDLFTLVFDRGCFHNIAPQDREAYIKGIYRVLKPSGKYHLICFSSRGRSRSSTPDSFSQSEIRSFFSPLFKIHFIRETPGKKTKDVDAYSFSVLMEKSRKTG